MSRRQANKDPDAPFGESDTPPVYTINLSLPPEQRYVALAKDYRDRLDGLSELLDDILLRLHPKTPVRFIRRLASIFLRRVYDNEENAELQGISRTLGLDMYLLILFNTLLDLMMGCTSGAARVRDRTQSPRLLHYRTLDWSMDPLRKLVVHLKFVRHEGGEVIAESVTYCGFVGILTGCRPGLSISLNFRAHRTVYGFRGNLSYRWHQLLVLFGQRRPIASIIRQQILGLPGLDQPIEQIARVLANTTSTAAYLILCDSKTAIVLEKDLNSAVWRSSESFIVATNHDHDLEYKAGGTEENATDTTLTTLLKDESLVWLFEESAERSKCIQKKWKRETRKDVGATTTSKGHSIASVQASKLRRWVRQWPTTNECTHFSCIMDPKEGRIFDICRWLEPPEPPF